MKSRNKKPTIAITGGAGYIGLSIANHLDNSFNIRLLDVRQPDGKFPPNVRFQKCDITVLDEVRDSLKEANIVIHTAIIQIPQINEAKQLAYNVDIVGTQNICTIAEKTPSIKGLILSGSWHTVGERGLKGVIDEEFGFRPDKVEDRARLYALAKMGQESIVRFHDEMSEKVYGIIRMGTVLGEKMPEKTAANIFISKGLEGTALTPFKNSMFRPMLYVDVYDVCRAYEKFARKILDGSIKKKGSSLAHIFNVYYPEAITIYDLANLVKDTFVRCTSGRICPTINIIDTGLPNMFNEKDKQQISADISKATKILGLKKLKSPAESIEKIVKSKLATEKKLK